MTAYEMRISDRSSDVCSSDLLDWALENGARMVSIRPAPVPGYRGSRSLGNPEFDPFWARVNESGIFVVLHVSDSGYDEIYRWWGSGSREFLAFDRSDPLKMCIDTSGRAIRSEEHTSELQSLMRNSYAVFCLKKKKKTNETQE